MNCEFYQSIISDLKSENNFRQFRQIELFDKYVVYKQNKLLNLSSNDYLGLATNVGFQDEFSTKYKALCFGSTSSRLLTGNSFDYEQLEAKLSVLYNNRDVLFMNSGYHANSGIIPALCRKGDLILADKLVHASIIDGIRLSDAKCVRFQHNDYVQLEKLLTKNRSDFRNIFIISESIFSMNGDESDLRKLTELKKAYGAFLYVDEAHAVGVRGKRGLGCAEEYGLMGEVDFIVGTCGKAFASMGAWVVCNGLFRDFLINTCRTLIFTTALAPVNILWTSFILDKIVDMSEEREKLTELSRFLSDSFVAKAYEKVSDSHIIPLIVGENDKAVRLSEKLIKAGFWVLPVRPPTVPDGTSRLRISLRSDITIDDLQKMLEVIPSK